MDLNRNNIERKTKDNSRNDIKNAFKGQRMSSKAIEIVSYPKPIPHEKDTSEIKLSNERFI